MAGGKAVHELRPGVAADQDLGLILYVQRDRARGPEDIDQLVAGLIRDQLLRHDADVERSVLDQARGPGAGDGCAGAIAEVLRAGHLEWTEDYDFAGGRSRAAGGGEGYGGREQGERERSDPGVRGHRWVKGRGKRGWGER